MRHHARFLRALAFGLLCLAPAPLRAEEANGGAGAEEEDDREIDVGGSSEEDELSKVELTAEPGRGVTMDAGDAFSLNLWGRLQIRSTTTWSPNESGERSPEHQIRPSTVRLGISGHVIDEDITYELQLAFGSGDLVEGSPIFDAFVELEHLRDLNVRAGQFFVPFDRARRMSEWGLQTVDRSTSVRELSLDRDVGVVVQSDDLFGKGGRLLYHVGVFGGEGRNLTTPRELGLLYVARVGVRPLGGFDDGVEGDLERSDELRILLGGGVAYDRRSARKDGNTGDFFELGSVDYLGLEADAMLKWRGLFLFAEVLYRRASESVITSTGPRGEPLSEWSRQGLGYVLQAGYSPVSESDLWVRWDELKPRHETDPEWLRELERRGREIAAGANYYANGHRLKVQAEYAYAFGVLGGSQMARLQLDASF